MTTPANSPEVGAPRVGRETGGASGSGSNPDAADLRLAGFVEELTRRIQAGETVDPDLLSGLDPAWGDEVRRLLPALRGLAELRTGGDDEVMLPLPEERDGQGRRVLGDFHIVREIGRGGMGVVYEAEQMPLGRPVALKVMLAAVLLNQRAVQRFQLEAQVAGLLQHPRIVPVYSVGTVGQIPYIAMQLVEGGSLADLLTRLRGLVDGPARPSDPADGPITALAVGMLSGRLPGSGRNSSGTNLMGQGEEAEPPAVAPLSVRTRAYTHAVARLGVQAAEALGHAHEHGVIHRDIKPANLLLDARGDLWVADFGMADVQGDVGLTETGDLPGTLRYMSPEQALGRRALVDHRTDVYSLGVTLYEMLALRPAIQGSDRHEILRWIAETEPTPLRQFNPAVSVDLATIIAKATSKDPAGRYPTAYHLAADLTQFLEGRPIAARPLGSLARTWRWCRRKPWQAGLSAALVLSVLGGLAGATWGWAEAVRQGKLLAASEAKTRHEAARVAAINRFLVDRLLGQASPETNPDAGRVTLMEVLDRAATEVEPSFTGETDIEAAVRLAIGRAYHGLGEYTKAESHLGRARQILRRASSEADPNRLEAETEYGHILGHLGRSAESEPILRQALDRARQHLGSDHRVSLRAAEAFAELLTDEGRYAEAEALYRRYSDEAERATPPDPEVILTARNNLGELLTRTNHPDQSEPLLRRVLDESTRLRGPDSVGTLSALNNLAIALEKQGKDAEAERLFRDGLARQGRALGLQHPGALTFQYNLAHVLGKLGRFDEAERLFRENLATQRQRNGREHPTTLYVASGLGAFLQARGRIAEAETLLRDCQAVQTRVLGADHPMTRQTSARLRKLEDARVAGPGASDRRP